MAEIIKSNWDSVTLCPFYRGVGQKRVFCESFLEDGCTISLGFKYNSTRDTQLRIFCSEAYENCEIYQMILGATTDEM